MEKNTNKENYIKYYNYVKDNMVIINSSGSKLALSKIDEIDSTKLDIEDIRKLCELVEFIKISENFKKLALYHEWYRYFRN
jgi:hypothetical protein